jgi:hypothetical protein
MQQLRGNPKYEHPYYWAPFVLVGDWRALTDISPERPGVAQSGD